MSDPRLSPRPAPQPVVVRRFSWLTPPAPAALAVVALPAVPCLDRDLPALGRARFARLLDRIGAVVDEVVAVRTDADRLELCCHGGAGVRAAVAAGLAGHGLAEAPAPGGDRWGELAAAAHPAAIAWLLAYPDAAPTFPATFLYRQPVLLLTGPANAGKSTLLNAWCGHARALVADAPGTTRDLVAAEVRAGGWRLRVLDSAGLRASDDPLERAGQELAQGARARADLVLYLLPPAGGAPQTSDLVVHGKADLLPPGTGLRWSSQGAHGRSMRGMLADIATAALARLGLPAVDLPDPGPP